MKDKIIELLNSQNRDDKVLGLLLMIENDLLEEIFNPYLIYKEDPNDELNWYDLIFNGIRGDIKGHPLVIIKRHTFEFHGINISHVGQYYNERYLAEFNNIIYEG